jgi:excisionase family DNA binding protein
MNTPLTAAPRSIAFAEGVKPLAVTVKNASRITGLGESTIWAMIADGRLKCARVGRRTLPLMESIERMLGIDQSAA